MPTVIPAFVNSVIPWGRSVPSGLVARWYFPQPFASPKSLANPAMLVDSARSADRAMKAGRP
jgi:hypothetical protein